MSLPLTPLQERFCLEYIVDHNATQAAIRAGASARAANRTASRWLSDVDIQERIRLLTEAQAQRLAVEADAVLRELLSVARSDIGEMMDFTAADGLPRLRPVNQISESARRAISSFKVKRVWEGTGDDARPVDVVEFKLWDKLSALDKLGKHLGLWKEQHEHSGPGGGPIPITYVEVGTDAGETSTDDSET